MMDRLREGVNGIAIKIILGLIILSFVFAGVGSYLVTGGNNTAAKVGNTEISQRSFEQAYQNERNRMQSQMGDYFSTLMGDPQYVQSFRKSVLDRMINDVLLEEYAKSLDLRVSDDQVRQLIVTMPQFQNDGKFDQDFYAAALRRAGFSPDSFAEYLRKDTLRQQVLSSLEDSEFTLPNEVAQQSKLLTQKRDIQSIVLNVADFAKKVDVTDEELQTYYKEHMDQYARPEQMKVAYVELSAEQLKKSIKITEVEAQKYYQEHLDKYSTKEQRKVRHILVKDEKKADEVLARLQSGEDFAQLAEETSEDVGSAKNGGELGWIEKGAMDPEFEAAAFELKNKDDISSVVKSNFGYHIIQLEDDKAPDAKPYSEVVDEIKSDLTDEKALDQFYKLQTKLESVSFESPDSLDDSAKAINQKIQTTEFISSETAPDVLKVPAVAKALENSDVKKEGLNSEVLEVAPEHVIVVRVNDLRSETILPLDDVKDKVKAQLAATKGEQDALNLSSKIVDSLKKGDDSVLVSNNLTFGDSQNIDRRSPLAAQAFALPHPEEGKASYGKAKDENGNIVILKLNKVTTSDDPQFQQQIASQLLRVNNQQDLEVVLDSLRKTTTIKYYAIEEQQ
ncbi:MULTISPECIES: peptidylprolyl isomerase [Vibrio]|uniref:Periplasmic chaperone PpiD n=1 Tax=Vibrio casei TaxID=673372 RepID=A0A368LLY8_9VIBR|nr:MULTISPECIES: peptidylprolyl isomerase [Vibrio]RCS72919.1 peptidylprolyl isomerase [Vibrio casei]SJN32372.1 Peptidyl-prolyl cis-trans isomerase PpiD [Vibrio casei]HBV75305.1 peptidylprolyl isomerase [Vibrio sp.]